MRTQGVKVINLKPGEIHVATEPTLITTLLGSCVSVCLYSPGCGIGAMSHSVLPSPDSRPCGHEMRYVESAIHKMLADMRRLGIPRERIAAKLFGGAEMLSGTSNGSWMAGLVGSSNAHAARMFLAQEGVKIVSECVGGKDGRKLIFDTSTGVVLVRKVGGRTSYRELCAGGGGRK